MRRRKIPLLPVALAAALFLQPAAAFALRQVTRSAEYPSPMGIYDSVSVSRTLRVGTQTTAAPLVATETVTPGSPSPANASQGSVIVNGNLHLQAVDAGFTDTTGSEHSTTQSLRDIVFDENLAVDGDTFKIRSVSWYGESHWVYINVPGYPSLTQRSAELHVNGDVYAQKFRASQNAGLNPDFDELLSFGPANDGDAHDGDWVDLRSKSGRTNPPYASNDSGWEHGYSVLVVKGNPYIVLNGYSQGNVGIGTESPTYKLQVGDAGSGFQAIGHSWQVFSSREFKYDIRPLAADEYRAFADNAGALDLVRYRYKKDSSDMPKKFGIIAEDSPKELLSPDGKTMSLGDTVGFLFAAIRGMKAENDALRAEIEKLETRFGAGEARS